MLRTYTFDSSQPYSGTQNCVEPKLFDVSPAHGWLGPILGYVYRYDFVDTKGGSWSEERTNGAKHAFTEWNIALDEKGVDVQFRPPLEGEGSSFHLLRTHIDDVPDKYGVLKPIGARTKAVPGGTISTAEIDFNNSLFMLNRERGYLKAGLHEIGHVLGLEHFLDPPSRPGTSVMNQISIPQNYGSGNFGGADDPAGWIPSVVTICDRRAAAKAAERR